MMHTSKFLKIAALCMAVVAVMATASCSLTGDTEEETTTEREAVTLEARPQSQTQILDFFNRAANAVKAARPGVSFNHDYEVKDVDTGSVPEAKALIQFAKNFSEALEGTGGESEYGADLTDVLPLKGTDTVSRLTDADIAEAEITDVEDDQYTYEVRILLKDGKEIAQNAYDFEVDKSKVLTTFADYKDTLEVSDYDVSYANCEIKARINKETDQIQWLRYERDALVTANVSFTGTMASLGEVPVQFTLHDTLTVENFVWEAPSEEASE